MTEYVTKQIAVSVPEQVPVTVMTTQQRQVPRQVAVTRCVMVPVTHPAAPASDDDCRASGVAPEVGPRSSQPKLMGHIRRLNRAGMVHLYWWSPSRVSDRPPVPVEPITACLRVAPFERLSK